MEAVPVWWPGREAWAPGDEAVAVLWTWSAGGGVDGLWPGGTWFGCAGESYAVGWIGDSSPCTYGVDPKPLDGCRRLSLWLGEPGVGAVGGTCTFSVSRETGRWCARYPACEPRTGRAESEPSDLCIFSVGRETGRRCASVPGSGSSASIGEHWGPSRGTLRSRHSGWRAIRPGSKCKQT